MIKCGRCGKECETIGMTYNEHYRIFARFRKDGENYGKCLDLCDSCHLQLWHWLLEGGYAGRDFPALPYGNKYAKGDM